MRFRMVYTETREYVKVVELPDQQTADEHATAAVFGGDDDPCEENGWWYDITKRDVVAIPEEA